jgi:hypothetical protein
MIEKPDEETPHAPNYQESNTHKQPYHAPQVIPLSDLPEALGGNPDGERIFGNSVI